MQTVVADRQYGTAENFRACYERGLRSHMGDLLEPQKEKGRREGIFPQEAFLYESATDTYRYPAGEVLSRRKHKTTRKCYEYAAPRSTCDACSLREQGTRAKGAARSVKRHYGQEAIEAARAQSHSEEGRRDRAKRQRQRIQDYLIATIQNVRIFLRHGGETPKAGVQVMDRTYSAMICVFGSGNVEIFSRN